MMKIAIAGVCGRMGRSVASLARNDRETEIVAATEMPGHEAVGRDVGEVLGWEKTGILVSDEVAGAVEATDVVIDFTSPEATLRNAEISAMNAKAMVIGTTGFSDEQRGSLLKILGRVPCVFSPNMSVGINVLFELSRRAAVCLGDGYDAEIFEAHHRRKEDAPSGTALALADSIALGRDVKLENVARYERHGKTGPRKKGEIGVQTLRGGDVVGDHTVMFLGDGERVELTHRATSRENFSSGALRAAKWLRGKPAGIYTMADVLGF